MVVLEDRILLHLQDGRRIPVDPQDIYFLEAEGGETLARTRHAQPFGSCLASVAIFAVVWWKESHPE
jgi:DNA-binding LytR/AlgR family response regulator